MDVVLGLSVLIMATLSLIQVLTQTTSYNTVVQILSSCNVLLSFLLVPRQLRGFQSVSTLVRLLSQVFRDAWQTLTLMLVVVVGFGLAFMALYSDLAYEGEDHLGQSLDEFLMTERVVQFRHFP